MASEIVLGVICYSTKSWQVHTHVPIFILQDDSNELVFECYSCTLGKPGEHIVDVGFMLDCNTHKYFVDACMKAGTSRSYSK